MSTAILKVSSLETSLADLKRVWKTGDAETPAITFSTWDRMHGVLSPQRLEIVRALRGQAPMRIRELSRRLGRDFKGAHTDLVTLIGTRLADQEDGKICFPMTASTNSTSTPQPEPYRP